MSEQQRSMDVLLMIVGAVDGLPLRMADVADAYNVGAITGAEAKLLQRYGRLSPRGRKAAALQPRDVTDAQVERMKTKLEARMVELEALRPHLRRDDVH